MSRRRCEIDISLYCRQAGLIYSWYSTVARWRNGYSVELAVSRWSWVQILLGATLRNNLGQVVHTYVPLLPGSITWYQLKWQ